MDRCIENETSSISSFAEVLMELNSLDGKQMVSRRDRSRTTRLPLFTEYLI